MYWLHLCRVAEDISKLTPSPTAHPLMASIATEASTTRFITDASKLDDIDDEDLPFLLSVVTPDEFLDMGWKFSTLKESRLKCQPEL
jgi:hypothetical protein